MRTINLSAALEPIDLAIQSGDIARGIMRWPAVLHCRVGILLVTIEGDGEDYQLGKGDFLRLPIRRLVVVEGNASVSITVLATACRWKNLSKLPVFS